MRRKDDYKVKGVTMSKGFGKLLTHTTTERENLWMVFPLLSSYMQIYYIHDT